MTSWGGEREIEQLRKELAEARAEIEELKAEEPPPDPPPDPPPKRKPKLRLIKGGGVVAAGTWIWRYWRQEVATVTASATTIAVLVWRPDISPDDLQQPPRPSSTPVQPLKLKTFDPSVPASPTTRTPTKTPLARTSPQAVSRPAPTMKTEPASPTPRRTTTPTPTPTRTPRPTSVLPTLLTRTLLPRRLRTLLPTTPAIPTPMIRPSIPCVIEPIGVTICIPSQPPP